MAQVKAARGIQYLTGAATYELIAKGNKAGRITSININNSSASNEVTATLFLNDGTNSINIAGPVVIVSGVTLYLDNMAFNNTTFGLKLTLAGTAPIVSVIIK